MTYYKTSEEVLSGLREIADIRRNGAHSRVTVIERCSLAE